MVENNLRCEKLTHSSEKYLSAHYVPGMDLACRNRAINMTDKISALVEFTIQQWRGRKKVINIMKKMISVSVL